MVSISIVAENNKPDAHQTTTCIQSKFTTPDNRSLFSLSFAN